MRPLFIGLYIIACQLSGCLKLPCLDLEHFKLGLLAVTSWNLPVKVLNWQQIDFQATFLTLPLVIWVNPCSWVQHVLPQRLDWWSDHNAYDCMKHEQRKVQDHMVESTCCYLRCCWKACSMAVQSLFGLLFPTTKLFGQSMASSP